MLQSAIGVERNASLRTIQSGLSHATLLTGLVVMLGAQQLLLWCFLGLGTGWALGLAAIVLAAFAFIFHRWSPWKIDTRASLPMLGGCFLIALAVFVLGGEGRFATPFSGTSSATRGPTYMLQVRTRRYCAHH
jgi:hypothetical protein